MSNYMWKDTLSSDGSRVAKPWKLNGALLPGYIGDSNPDPVAGYQQRRDFDNAGTPNDLSDDFISGSGDAYGRGRTYRDGRSTGYEGPSTPSPGFQPVDPGQYGNNPYFAGRNAPTAGYLAGNKTASGNSSQIAEAPTADWLAGGSSSSPLTKKLLELANGAGAGGGAQNLDLTPLLRSLLGLGSQPLLGRSVPS